MQFSGVTDQILLELKKEKLELENEVKRIHLAVEKKLMLSREEVSQKVNEMIYATKTAYLSQPRRLSQKLVGKTEREIFQIIEEDCEDFLGRFWREGGVLK